MASNGETDEQCGQSDSVSIDTVDSGVGSSLSSLSLDDRTATEPGGDASRESIIQAALTESDALPDMVDLREYVSSSTCNAIQLSEIVSYMDQQSNGADQSLSQREQVGIQWRPESNGPEFFDVAMVYCLEDEDLAKKFGELLQKFIILDGQQKPRIYTDFLDLRDPLGSNKTDHFNHVLGCSSFSFVFFSRKSVDSQDLKGKFERTVALHGSVTDENCATVVPIVTEKNLPLQYTFGVLNEISLKALLLNGRILELVSVDDLKMEHINKRVLDPISNALNDARKKRQYKVTNCGASNFEQPVDVNPPTTLTADQKSGHTELIQRYYPDLVDSMDPECGLLSHLFSQMALSFQEMESITAEKTRTQKNMKLLNLLYLKDAKTFEKFVCCLSESTQDHLAEMLRGPIKKE